METIRRFSEQITPPVAGSSQKGKGTFLLNPSQPPAKQKKRVSRKKAGGSSRQAKTSGLPWPATSPSIDSWEMYESVRVVL